MNPDRLHQWLQLLGAASIVASLIFVGLQLKQSQEIAIASQYQARYDSAAEHLAIMTDSELKLKLFGARYKAEFAAHPNFPDDVKNWVANLPAEEFAFYVTFAYLGLKSFDNLYFQYQSGFLDEESWQALRQEHVGSIDSPVLLIDMRALYEGNPTSWRAPFREMIEEVIAEFDAGNN